MSIIYGTQGTIMVNGELLAHAGAWEADIVDVPFPRYLPLPRTWTFTITQSDWQRQEAVEALVRLDAWIVRNRFRQLPYRIMRRKLRRLLI